jgi:hypothetical protein
VDNLSENIKRGHRQKLRKGIWPGFAPLGYLNNSKTKSIDIDTEKSVLVRKCFELYATGDHTLKNIKQFLADSGMNSYKGNVLSTSSVQRMLKNPFYYGTFRFNGELYEGSHEPIISKKLFDDVQQVMNNRGKKKRKRKHEFAFSGFMKCGKCGCLITAETQKGHIYYRCTKKKQTCNEKYLREEALVEQMKSVIQKVSIPDDWAENMLAELDREKASIQNEGVSFVQNLKTRKAEVEQKIDRLLDIYIEGKGRVNWPVTGEGNVDIFHDGQVYRGTWKKADRTSRTLFFDASGNPIPMLQGNSWVEIVPDSIPFSYQ